MSSPTRKTYRLKGGAFPFFFSRQVQTRRRRVGTVFAECDERNQGSTRTVGMRVFLALALCTTAHALAVGAIPLLRCTAAPALCVSMSSDEALWASLKARIAVSEDESAAPPPLGIDDVGADCMGPSDVVEYVMRSMKADADAGATSLMSFAVKYDGAKTEV